MTNEKLQEIRENYVNHIKNFEPLKDQQHKEKAGRWIFQEAETQIEELTFLSGTSINCHANQDLYFEYQGRIFVADFKIRFYSSSSKNLWGVDTKKILELLKIASELNAKRNNRKPKIEAAIVMYFTKDDVFRIYSIPSDYKRLYQTYMKWQNNDNADASIMEKPACLFQTRYLLISKNIELCIETKSLIKKADELRCKKRV